MIANFEVKIEDVAPEALVELEGVRGPYVIGIAARNPEIRNAFFYGDAIYKFFFYADAIIPIENEKPYSVEVLSATTEMLGWERPFKANIDDVDYIEENIRRSFQARAYYNLKTTIYGSERSVVFKWKIAK